MKNAGKLRDLDKILSRLGKEYRFGGLSRKDLSSNPFDQFARWFLEAVKHKDPKANVMVLATAGRNRVSTRSVLLKGFDDRGFLFYTNTKSRKARELSRNSRASICFYWAELERQVTAIGRAEKIPRGEARIYFRSRPREAQIAAWCTRQSRVIRNRDELERRFLAIKKKYEGRAIPFNPEWAGYRLKPEEFEFWQGRANRLNDRFRYRSKDGTWLIERLQP